MWLTVPVSIGGSDRVLLPDVLISKEHNGAPNTGDPFAHSTGKLRFSRITLHSWRTFIAVNGCDW